MVMQGGIYDVGEHIPVTAELVQGALGTIAATMGRLDGEAICEFHRRVDSEAIAQWTGAGRPLPRGLVELYRADQAEHPDRHDALPAGSSTLPRELEFIRARELEEVRAPLNAYSLFPVDRSVPVGAAEHTWRRRVGRGEAVLTRGDTQNYGHARSGRFEEKFPTAFIVCAVRQTLFEMFKTDYAGVDQYRSDLRTAYRLVDELRNSILWSGDTATQLWGALNHPGLMKKAMGVTFGGANPTAAATLLAAMHALVDAPAVYSGEAMQPTTLVVSPKIYRHISQTRLDSGTDTTILQFFLAGQDENNGIRRVRKAQELAGIGPSGEDGLFAYRDEQDAISIIETLPTMTMPVYQASAMSWLTLVLAGTGGTVMANVGENILGFASAP